jgi:hypothetical protein
VKKLKLTLESSSHPSPCLDSLEILALLGFGGVFWKLEEGVCSWGVSSTEWKRWRGIYRATSKTSRCWDFMRLSELPTSSKTRGREGFIGNYLGPPKGGSELSTVGRNFRPGYFLLVEDPLSDETHDFRGGRNFRPLLKFSDLVPVCALCQEMDGWFLF